MKPTVCIPMYNESGVIVQNMKILQKAMSEYFDAYEIIVIDDGSTDGCGELVENLQLPGLRTIRYEPNCGKGYAVRTGMMAANGDLVLFTDADLAYGTDVIRQICMLAEANPDAQILVGSRNLSPEGYEGYTLLRKLASKTYLKILKLFGGLKLSDSQCGFKAFRKDAIEKICPLCRVDRFAFDFEMLMWADVFGMKTLEMPVKVLVHGESKVHIVKDTCRMLSDLRKMKKRIKKQAKSIK